MTRRGAGALELAVALALLVALATGLPRPGRRRVRGSSGDRAAAWMEQALADVHGARALLGPVATREDPVSLPSHTLDLVDARGEPLRYRFDPSGLVRTRGAGADAARWCLPGARGYFEVRRRAAGVRVVRVRLLAEGLALYSGARLGSWRAGRTP